MENGSHFRRWHVIRVSGLGSHVGLLSAGSAGELLERVTRRPLSRGEIWVARALVHLTGTSASLHLGAGITDSRPLGRGQFVRLFCHLTRTSTLVPVLVTRLPKGPSDVLSIGAGICSVKPLSSRNL